MDRFKILKGQKPTPLTPDSIIGAFVSEEKNNGICFKFQDGREAQFDYDENNEVTLDESWAGTIVELYDFTGKSISFNGHRI